MVLAMPQDMRGHRVKPMGCHEPNAFIPAQSALASLNCGITLITTAAISMASSLTATSEAAASSLVTRSPRWTRPCRRARWAL